MKTLLLALMTVVSTSAQASEPSVRCWMMYNKVDDQGISIVHKNGEGIQISTQNSPTSTVGGFQLTGRLEQICAVAAPSFMGGSPGNLPCTDSYSLNVRISRGEVESNMYVTVDGGDANLRSRSSTALTVGKETGFVNCDIDSTNKQ
ncbi:MAG: hypothetical protein NDI61_06800 [Bdellovibrionaceae bacterium]|nr:hypothetical protein [Pseudobdellovibrionaceae bacterium]